MAEVHTYDGDELTTVRLEATEFTQVADHGAVGSGTITIDDTAGTLEVIGQKDYTHEEDACANALTFAGYIAQRTYARRGGPRRGPNTGLSRAIVTELLDVNDRLNHKLITDGGKRPAESVGDRLRWLLASGYAPFADNGRVTYPTTRMDKSDYRNQFAGDVISDCALAAGPQINHYLADWGAGAELIFRNDHTSTDDSSTLRISNVVADVDSTEALLGPTKTFRPLMDATLKRDPEDVHSKHAASFAKGTEVQNRAATAAAFNGERGGTSSNSNIRTRAMARRAADRELRIHSVEDDEITVTIQVPAEAVNLVYAGWRLQAKFSHLTTEGYGSFTWMRVRQKVTRRLPSPTPAYELDLTLVPQQEGAASSCPFDLTESGTFYPLGLTLPDWSVYPWGVSDGVTYYLRPGIFYPVTPTPGHLGVNHFSEYGAGGQGSTAYAGDCVSNTIQFMVVGAGTMTIQTEVYAGSSRPITVTWGESPNAYTNHVGDFDSGDEIEIEITGECVNLVRIADGPGSPCGGKWGFSQMVWEAA